MHKAKQATTRTISIYILLLCLEMVLAAVVAATFVCRYIYVHHDDCRRPQYRRKKGNTPNETHIVNANRAENDVTRFVFCRLANSRDTFASFTIIVLVTSERIGCLKVIVVWHTNSLYSWWRGGGPNAWEAMDENQISFMFGESEMDRWILS